MRTMTANALAELAKKLGTEPVMIFEIQWTDGGSLYRYGDTDDPANNIDGRVLQTTGLDNVITINGVTQAATGESLQLGVTLDDRDGLIKSIFDQNDIHKRPVFVYQWFPNLDYSDKFLLYKGLVSSPLEGHEGDRSVRFDIINELEDAEVGFSVEEGNIEFAPDDLYGKAWPLVFGTCVHVPALKLRQSFSGTLRTGFGVHDFTLECKLDQINNMCCPLVFTGWRTVRSPSPPFSLEVIATYQEEPGCKCRRLAQINQWGLDIATQTVYEISTLEIIDGELFPQNTQVTLDICGAKVKGKFNGSTFTVTSYVHPQKAELTCPETKRWLGCNVRELPPDQNGTDIGGGFYSARDQSTNFGTGATADCGIDGPQNDRTNLGWDYLSTFPTADFFWAEPGCEVFLEGNEEIVYVVNLLPSTILRVAAYRTFDSGVRELVTIPASYYTTRVSDFNGYMVTEIVFSRELSRRGEGWEDEVYVSQTSSVGPNTVDIMEWLIDKYTDFTTDAASFADVKTKIDNYPSSFPILERRNVFDVLKDIAFQARCAIYLRNDVFFLKYLSDEPSADFTITEDDVLPKSLVTTHTETEELVTKLIADWHYDYAIEEDNKVILRYNIKRYGTQEKTFNFFIYNIRDLVEKSATFWLIRMANTWRRLKFRTPMTKLQAEVLDTVDVTLSYFSSNTIKCIVEKATYDSESHEMEFEVWTPVRAGSTDQFVFAWPSQIDVDNIWPTLEDQKLGNAGGSGPNVNVTAPSLHPLARPDAFSSVNSNRTNCNKIGKGTLFESAGSIIIDGCRSDHGDKRPSDKDDTKETVKVLGDGETDISSKKNPTGTAQVGSSVWVQNQHATKEEADKADATVRDGQANDGGGGTESGMPPADPLDNLPCDDSGLRNCTVRVAWKTHIVRSVITGGMTSTTPGDTGDLASSPPPDTIEDQSLTFDSLEAANDAYSILVADYFSPSTVDEAHIAPGTASVVGASLWSANGCLEPGIEDRQVTAFCGTDNGKTTATLAANKGLGLI